MKKTQKPPTVKSIARIILSLGSLVVIAGLVMRLMAVNNVASLPRPVAKPRNVNPLAMASKRLFDVMTSAVGLLLVAPLMLGIAVAIKITSPGPIFYRTHRVGRHNRQFQILKFRTMVVNADKIGPGITVCGDPRITRIGCLLRQTKLDELPQLLNVLRGEMSLVGPRPEDPRYVALYTREQRAVLNVAPGITSPASLHFCHEEALLSGTDWEAKYIKEILPTKLAIDLEYAKRPSLQRDITVISNTLKALYTNRVQRAA